VEGEELCEARGHHLWRSTSSLGSGGHREELQRWVKGGRTSCKRTRRRRKAGRAAERLCLYLDVEVQSHQGHQPARAQGIQAGKGLGAGTVSQQHWGGGTQWVLFPQGPYCHRSPAEPRLGVLETGVTSTLSPSCPLALPLASPVVWTWVSAPEIRAHQYLLRSLSSCLLDSPITPRKKELPRKGRGGGRPAQPSADPDEGPQLLLNCVCFSQPVEDNKNMRADLRGHQG